eukprot:1161503-Pelagomonas_calceolata.AAC.9
MGICTPNSNKLVGKLNRVGMKLSGKLIGTLVVEASFYNKSHQHPEGWYKETQLAVIDLQRSAYCRCAVSNSCPGLLMRLSHAVSHAGPLCLLNTWCEQGEKEQEEEEKYEYKVHIPPNLRQAWLVPDVQVLSHIVRHALFTSVAPDVPLKSKIDKHNSGALGMHASRNPPDPHKLPSYPLDTRKCTSKSQMHVWLTDLNLNLDHHMWGDRWKSPKVWMRGNCDGHQKEDHWGPSSRNADIECNFEGGGHLLLGDICPFLEIMNVRWKRP